MFAIPIVIRKLFAVVTFPSRAASVLVPFQLPLQHFAPLLRVSAPPTVAALLHVHVVIFHVHVVSCVHVELLSPHASLVKTCARILVFPWCRETQGAGPPSLYSPLVLKT